MKKPELLSEEKKKKIDNFFYYYKFHVLIGAFILFFCDHFYQRYGNKDRL